MTTLVTGATGFVGSAVARRLLELDHEVRVLVRAGSDRRNLQGLSVETVEGDLRDRASLERAVSGCDALFHVAADYRLWAPDPSELYDINVDGSIELIKAAGDAGVDRIVYTSSVATLGLNPDHTPADEDTPVSESDMIGHYKRSKFIAEREIRTLAKREHLPVVVVNPSTPIGPRDVKPTPTGRVIVQAAAGKIPAFVDTGLNVVHVDDVAEGHVFAYQRGVVGERYILGGENWTLQELLALVAELTGRRAPKIRLSHALVLPMAHIAEIWARVTRATRQPLMTVDGVRMSAKHMFFSSQKAIDELGYSSRSPVEAISEAIQWFKSQGYC